MSCYHPILAVDYGIDPLTGKHKVKILPVKTRVDTNIKKYKDRYGDSLLQLPCGHCIGCVKDYRASWAVRILLEASLYKENSFITLTYDPKYLPKDNQPHRDEIVRFMKRLRKEIGVPIRYFYCGEKGDKNPTGDETGGRAHYHAIIFGYNFPDKEFLHISPKGSVIYKSRLLSKCWKFGLSSIGEVEPGSAYYVASYANKKKLKLKNGDDNDHSFVGMSRMPGLGSDVFNLKWFRTDTIYCALGAASIPRFFHKLLEGLKPDCYEAWKSNRKKRCSQRIGNMYIYGMNEEETYLYDEHISLIKYLQKTRSYL